jgi:isoleucyl-tRNA synthetase
MTAKNFPEYGNDYSFPSFENQVLEYWRAAKIFERSLEASKGKPEFFFYDGPPFATGTPHYGHILAGTIKDIVPRYWSLRGYHVPRRFGWDTHGLPVEFEMEKTLGLKGSLDIQDYGVGKFNEACRGIVLRYTGEWRKTVERMGRWIDMDNDYKTMDPTFMESVWWVFKELWEKKRVYRGKKVVPYSWRLTAALSNFEASLNYKDVQDPSITVIFPLKGKDYGLGVWTTTPWTLPSNLGVAVSTDASKITYGVYRLTTPVGSFEKVLMADSRAEAYGLSERLASVDAKTLINAEYEPLFSCYGSQPKAFRVLDGTKFISSEDGTGLVHMAPAFGEDDFFTCQAAGIDLVDPTDVECKFTDVVAKDARLKDVVGLFVKDADKALIKVLKDSGLLLKQDTLQHAYPYCYRSDQPLIYKGIDSWYVRVEGEVKESMIRNNQQIRWVPEHIKDGRFGKWLENARDWCISRNRFWGTPIPVWVNEKDSSDCIVIGSRAELEQVAGKSMTDLHKHFVDEVVIQRDGKTYRRTPEVLDCWFESGAMPYAQEHYPFENKVKFEGSFPATFIAEGLDQTRGWFYTLTVLSSALFDQPAFKNCIVNGMILAEDGKKMSKSLKNYPDPAHIFEKYGADALRLYLMQSPAMHAEELRFSEKNLVELMRAVMIPLWNSYSFFSSYANIDAWDRKQATKEQPFTKLDRWILARAKETETAVHARMESYRLYEVAPLLVDLIDDLTNWYIRLNRDRFWAGNAGNDTDKNAAYAALWRVLDRLSMLLAPGLPYIAEVFNAALNGKAVSELVKDTAWKSVHERQFTATAELSVDEHVLLDEIALAKKVVLLGRSLRGEAKISLRQPLKQLRVAGLADRDRANLDHVRQLICDEVNVKELVLVAKASDLVEESVKPNFRAIGKKVGSQMKAVQAELAQWGHVQIEAFEKSGKVDILGFTLDTDDVQVVRKAKEGRAALAAYGLVAELDTQLSPELVREGLQREVINRIQQRRKEMKLHLADRIRVVWTTGGEGALLRQVLEGETKTLGPIAAETLCKEFKESAALGSETQVSLDEHGSFSFRLEKL